MLHNLSVDEKADTIKTYESSGYHQREDTDGEQGSVQLGGSRTEAQLRIFESTNDESRPQHQQQVAEQATQKGALHECELAAGETDAGNDEFGKITEGRVQKRSDGRASSNGNLLGSKSKKGRERHDGERRRDKDDGVGLVSEMQSPRNRNKGQQDVEGRKLDNVDQRATI